jgi:hypothetical protein
MLHARHFACPGDWTCKTRPGKIHSAAKLHLVKICFATIVSPNYLAYARVLGESLARHAAQADFQTLVVTRRTVQVRDAVDETGLQVIYAEELGLPDFEQLAYKYDLVELNTALKPSFLKALLARGYDRVVYLDPDICLFDAPLPVLEALDLSEIVLIPHALAPAMDGLRPSDIDFLRTGTFNLGFIGLRQGAHSSALLDWWESRCLSHGFNDPGYGIFVDQKWLDLAQCYFESVRVLKHPGCNVAYWNLHERRVEHSPHGYRVNGEALIFFHFSGVDAASPGTLSRHQNRHAIVAGSALADLVRDYCSRLQAAGHSRWSGLPYSFASRDDGTAITPLMRRAAIVPTMDAAQPFAPGSPFQQSLERAGLTRGAPLRLAKTTTLDFDAQDRSVVLVNRLIRLISRLIGAERLGALLRYATFLGWQSNAAAVLLDEPFDLEHRDRRTEAS